MYCRALRQLRPALFIRLPTPATPRCYNLPTGANLLCDHSYNLIAKRFRSYSKKKQRDAGVEEAEADGDPTLSRDSKLVNFQSPSMRMDIVVKSALGISRNKVEKLFYESKIRLNGQKVMKKSVQIHIGDEVDIIKGPSQHNPEHLYVSRVEIMDATAGETNIIVTARRFKSLLIENYESDPYRPSSDDSSSN